VIKPRDSVGSTMSSVDQISTKFSEIDRFEIGLVKLKERIEEEELVMNQIVKLLEGRRSNQNLEDLIEALLYELRIRKKEEKLVKNELYMVVFIHSQVFEEFLQNQSRTLQELLDNSKKSKLNLLNSKS